MEIKPYKKNSKIHTQDQLKDLAMIVAEIGWRQPVEVNQKGVIVVGHARYTAWLEFKDTFNLPEVWIIDDKGKTIKGKHSEKKLTSAQEKMWRIADNRLSELGSSWDYGILKEEFEELNEQFRELSGFDEDDLSLSIDGNNNFNSEDEWEDMPEYNNSDIKNYKSVVIHFKTEQDLKDFCSLINQKITSDTKFIYYPEQKRDVLINKRYES